MNSWTLLKAILCYNFDFISYLSKRKYIIICFSKSFQQDTFIIYYLNKGSSL